MFREEEFLLFSPSIADLNASGNTMLWLNLIGYNGSCWQSYGPIGAYQSFGKDDVLFFATEHNPDIEEGWGVCADIEKNPLPYMMLLSGAAYPRTYHKEDETIYNLAEYDMFDLDTARLKRSFTSEYDSGVYRFTDNKYGEYPHFAQLYFDERMRIVLFTAMTDRGFHELIRNFNSYGYDFSESPALSVRLQMITTAEAILKRRIVVNEYFDRFKETSNPETTEAVGKLNDLMALVLPDINAGRKPDIEAAAMKAGVSIETAHELLEQVMAKFDQMPGGSPQEGNLQQPEDKRKKVAEGNRGKSTKDRTPAKNIPGGGAESLPVKYSKIYSTARKIRELEPWKVLFETDLFGIEIPGTDQVYFISVMGHNMEFTAISAYKGYEGFAGFMELEQNADELPMGTIMTVPHLMLSFMDREGLMKADLDAIRQSGEGFRGKGNWPKLDEVIPGYVPVFPEGESLHDLPVLLEQILQVLLVALKEPGYLNREGDGQDEILLRKPAVRKGVIHWEDHYEDPHFRIQPEHFRVTYDGKLCATISRKKVAKAILQADMFMLPTPAKEKEGKGYFPFVLLLVDKETGMVKGMSMMVPEPDLHTMYERVGQTLLEELNKSEQRPEKVELRTELLLTLTEDALKQAWCMPVLENEMPLVEEVRKGLFEHLW